MDRVQRYATASWLSKNRPGPRTGRVAHGSRTDLVRLTGSYWNGHRTLWHHSGTFSS